MTAAGGTVAGAGKERGTRSRGAAPDRFEDDVVELLPDLLGAAKRMAGDAADAEDLVAEAVAKAWAHRDTLEDPGAFRGWMFRILTNTFISERRARERRPEQESLDAPAAGEEAGFSLFERLHQPFLMWWGETEREFLDNLLREDLENAIGALPDEFRVVVVLADLQGFKYQEIADTLGVPIGTVRSRLARARARLQQALWDHAVDAGLADERPGPRERTE